MCCSSVCPDVWSVMHVFVLSISTPQQLFPDSNVPSSPLAGAPPPFCGEILGQGQGPKLLQAGALLGLGVPTARLKWLKPNPSAPPVLYAVPNRFTFSFGFLPELSSFARLAAFGPPDMVFHPLPLALGPLCLACHGLDRLHEALPVVAGVETPPRQHRPIAGPWDAPRPSCWPGLSA